MKLNRKKKTILIPKRKENILKNALCAAEAELKKNGWENTGIKNAVGRQKKALKKWFDSIFQFFQGVFKDFVVVKAQFHFLGLFY